MWIEPTPTLDKVGGKAYQLYLLKQWCNVPPYFVIAFQNPDEISEPGNQQRIIEQCRNNKFDLMAVRSSASCEDSPQTSFAGMFKTVLGVEQSSIIDAVVEVLNSVFGERVANYCESQGLAQDKIRMAVIVQKMINSRVSGVCFTRTQSDGDSLLVEACYGLGEALVSGRIVPDSYVVNRDNMLITQETVGYQKLMLCWDKEKFALEDVPFHKRNARKLTYEQVRNVARTCLLIEERLDFGVADIEWAFAGDTLYVLQARPYTAFTDSSVKHDGGAHIGGDVS